MKLKLCALLSIFCISSTYASWIPLDAGSLVIAPRVRRSDEVKESVSTLPQIYEMNIHTNVSNRFAKTVITTKVKNSGNKAQEAQFSVVTPEQAFISAFVMEIGGKKYEAYVQEKEQAKKTYEDAISAGQAAGHVAVSARDSKRFTVQVNVEPESKVIFYLTYEELLKRDNDKYEIVLNIQPGQPVEKLEAQVDINESRKIKFVDTPALRSGNEVLRKESEELKPEAVIQRIGEKTATVKFHPSIEKQKKYASSLKTEPENGFQGQFVVEYDVERDPQGGEVLVDETYFVHFFAPSDLKPLPKKVVFVLDTSGSMNGQRISQLKQAMHKILEDLKTEDVFSIVEFNWGAKVWNINTTAVQYATSENNYGYYEPKVSEVDLSKQPIPEPFAATKENIVKAKTVVDKLEADGGTDISSALTVALKIVKQGDDAHQPMIIFLTDGEATVGTVDSATIDANIKESNLVQCPIFAISLGEGADRSFLEKISLNNNGFSKRIYEGADVSIQLEDFYAQISSPLLSNVTFTYTTRLPTVKDVTKDKFGILFGGKEVVIAGRKGSGFVPPPVDAWSRDGLISLTPKVEQSAGSLERLWAYLTLKQMLEKRASTDDKNISADALKLALKYSFVSDVTSLVVVKPNATKSVDLEDGSVVDGGIQLRPFSSGGYAAPGASFAATPVHRLQFSTRKYASTTFHSVQYSRPYASKPLLALQSGGSGSLGSYGPRGGGYSAMKSGSAALAPSLEDAFVDADVTAPISSSKIDILKSSLPWLDSILNANGSISLTSGVYDLGLDEPITEGDTCHNAPTLASSNSNTTVSTCRLLDGCSVVYDVITSVQEYEKHFCTNKGYAGVCCPH